LNSLEDSIRDLNKAIKEVNHKQKEQPIVKFSKRIVTRQVTEKKTSSDLSKSQCTWRRSPSMNTTFEVGTFLDQISNNLSLIFQVRQLYETLPFDNPNGGIWSQGFDIQYNTSQWTRTNKLKIILMPHSHCDPGLLKHPNRIYSIASFFVLGWLNTYEQYFFHATKHILDTMINILDQNSKYKFIWAEMSFLSLWWDQAKFNQREKLKKFIHNRQFEIVTGGWVMNDEANTHYFAMLDQLIEGHQFIENKFG